ncbi:MAG: porin family protein [Phocaeicola sp.]
MKRLVGLILLFVCLGTTLPVQAQLKFGVKGGVNVSKLSFSSSTFESDNRAGWFFGPMAEFTIPILGIGVDVAGLYTQNELNVDGYNSKLKTIEVPVNLKWTMGLGSMLGVFIAAGPQFGFNVGDRSFTSLRMDDKNTSFNIGAGVKLIRHLQLGVNYNFGLSDVAVIPMDGSSSIEVKQKSWQISAAYIF